MLNFVLDTGCRTMIFPIWNENSAIIFEKSRRISTFPCSISIIVRFRQPSLSHYSLYYWLFKMMAHISFTHTHILAIFWIRKHMQMYFLLLFIRSFHSIIHEYVLTELHAHHIITLCTARAFLNHWIKDMWLYSSYYTHFSRVWFRMVLLVSIRVHIFFASSRQFFNSVPMYTHSRTKQWKSVNLKCSIDLSDNLFWFFVLLLFEVYPSFVVFRVRQCMKTWEKKLHHQKLDFFSSFHSLFQKRWKKSSEIWNWLQLMWFQTKMNK